MAIDPELPIPVYIQLKALLLLEEVLEGRYWPGGRLPTEHERHARFRGSHRAAQCPLGRPSNVRRGGHSA